MKISAFALGLTFLALLSTPGAQGQGSTGQTWLWATPERPVPGRHLSLTVSRVEDGPADQIIHFDCAVRSTVVYNNTRVVFELRDEEGALVSTGEQRLDVLAGANQCRIALDATALPLGTYRARFYLNHTQNLDEPSHSMIIRKVNGDNLLALLAESRTRLGELEQALDSAGNDGVLPYLRLKATVAADALKKAEANGQSGEWESLEPRLRFVIKRLDAIHAGMVLGETASERLPKAFEPRLDGLVIEKGGFSAEGRPVFLFGGALPAVDAEALALLRRYQLNAATVTVGREERPEASQDSAHQLSRLREVFESRPSF
jgi:hypothetical protein